MILRPRLTLLPILLLAVTAACSSAEIAQGLYFADEGTEEETLEFTASTWKWRDGSGSEVVGSYVIDEDSITVSTVGVCPENAEGTYIWSADGDTLFFEVHAVVIRSGDDVLARFPADTCIERLRIFDGRSYRLVEGTTTP